MSVRFEKSGPDEEETMDEVGEIGMQRRIKALPQETAAYQDLIDHKQATLNVILSRIPDISTFAQLGELIGYSHEWVRQRLVQAPEKLYKNGKRYKVPKA